MAADGIECTIAQVEYSAGPTGTTVHVFGRDRAQNPVHVKVTGFRPYFYVPEDQAQAAAATGMLELEAGTTYTSIRGERLRRLYANRPADVRDIRSGFDHYEADIPFTTRFLIDAGLHGGLKVPAEDANFAEVEPSEIDVRARCCFIDIECEDERGFPDPNRDKIICITCHDSYDDRYTSFLLRPGQGRRGRPRGARRRPQQRLREGERPHPLRLRTERSISSPASPSTSSGPTPTSSRAGTWPTSTSRTSSTG